MNEIQDIQNLYNEVRDIIASARQNAVRSVDFCRVPAILSYLSNCEHAVFAIELVSV